MITFARAETPTLAAGQDWGLSLDTTGALRVTAGAAGGFVVTGAETPSDNYANPTDALNTASLLMGWDGATWDRIRTFAADADSVASPALGLLGAACFLFGYDGTNWDRLRVNSTNDLEIAEQFAPAAEDNTNGVYAINNKPIAANTYAPSLFTNFATDPDVSVKGSAGNVYSLCVDNLNAATRYAQLHNKASAPAAAEVPLLTFKVPATTQLIVGKEFFTENGIYFSTGIAAGFSTTQGTYTAGAAGDQFTQITYK